MDEAEANLLREINRRPGVRVLVSTDESEAAGKRLVSQSRAVRDAYAFVSVKPRKDELRQS